VTVSPSAGTPLFPYYLVYFKARGDAKKEKDLGVFPYYLVYFKAIFRFFDDSQGGDISILFSLFQSIV